MSEEELSLRKEEAQLVGFGGLKSWTRDFGVE
jgi:hypothetical protein